MSEDLKAQGKDKSRKNGNYQKTKEPNQTALGKSAIGIIQGGWPIAWLASRFGALFG
jgi:hypothetical protein